MLTRMRTFLLAALLVAVSAPASWAALVDLGVPVTPHGYPAFYQDSNALKLELCLDPPADPIAGGPCLFDPVAAGNAWSAATGFGAEAFFWSATAEARPLVADGRALLVLALEAAYGGDGSPVEGQQMIFGRVRVRINVPGPGFYRIIHPYGTIDLNEAFTAESLAAHGEIRLTTDIGASNPIDPAAAFRGALQAWDSTNPATVPFLTWPNFSDPAANPTLQVPILDATGLPTGRVIQYVGDGVTPHTVTGSPAGNNFFRIQLKDPDGRFRTVTETDLFVVEGKVHTPPVGGYALYTFPPPPPRNLFAVGPVNRAAAFPAAGNANAHPGGVPASPEFPADPSNPVYPAGTGYIIGYPYWYQDTPDDIAAIIAGGGTEAAATPGIKLTLCPGSDPMCISAPINPADPASVALKAGEESFYWSAVADIAARTATNRMDAKLVMALEAAFGNALGTPANGDQVVFARIRVRLKVDLPGDYTVIHPYGRHTFTITDATEDFSYTEDIGIINPGITPDADFKGALFGKINPFLTWDTFKPNMVATDPDYNLLVIPNPADPLAAPVRYVGNPLARHAVTGSPTGENFFRVTGPGGIDATETLFSVTGKVYDPATFNLQPLAAVPTALNDTATTAAGLPMAINVVNNDIVPDGAPPITAVSVITALGPVEGGTAVANGTTITYTPAPGFTGIETFSYTAINAAGTSNIATVEVTVSPVEILATTRAALDLRKLELNIQGTSTLNGSTITIHFGSTTAGPVIGTALVSGGKWIFRGRATSNPGVSSISVVSSTGKMLLNQPLRVR